MRITLYALDPSFGNSTGLYKSLSLKHDVTAVFKQHDRKEMWREIPCVFNLRYVPRYTDHYIIVGAKCFKVLQRFYPSLFPLEGNSKVTVIITDSMAKNNIRECQKMLQNYRLVCMSDLAPFYDCIDIYYPPFEWGEEIIKNEELTIAHSPFCKAKKHSKGTKYIIRVAEELGIRLDVIEGVSQKEAIKRKSKAHIFIDQIIPPEESGWSGALGKSGIEGMGTGCLTLTSGRIIDQRSSIPPPPAIRVDRNTVKDVLQYYITHEEEERQQKAQEQQQWVKKYLNYEQTAIRTTLQLQ